MPRRRPHTATVASLRSQSARRFWLAEPSGDDPLACCDRRLRPDEFGWAENARILIGVRALLPHEALLHHLVPPLRAGAFLDEYEALPS